MKRLLLCIILCMPVSIMAQFSGGTGLETDPYLISTEADLIEVNDYLSAHFEITNNIELIANWEPIGAGADPFEGTINGKGFEITGLNAKTNYYTALFGNTNEATFDSITIVDCVIEGVEYAGALVGNLSTNSRVTNCSATGTVYGIERTGGLIGNIYVSVVENSSFSGSVTGYSLIGGFAGQVYNVGETSSITNCVSKGSVEGVEFEGLSASNIGGLVGYVEGANITDCKSYSNVTSQGNYIGGIVGLAPTINLENCSSYANVTGNDNVGGIAGSGSNMIIKKCSSYGVITGVSYVGGITGNAGDNIEYCASYGAVSGEYSVGGVAGIAIGSIKESFSTGSVTGTEGHTGGIAGGFFGDSVMNSYNLGDVTGNTNVGGICGNMGSAKVYNVYNLGVVSTISDDSSTCGTIIGVPYSTNVNNAYYSNDSYAGCGSIQGDSLSIDDMKIEGSYTDWDFNTIWTLNNGVSLPGLTNNMRNVIASNDTFLKSTVSELSVTEGDTISITITDLLFAESNIPTLTVILSSTDSNCTIVENRIIPDPSFTGELRVLISVSDGDLVSNVISATVTVDAEVVEEEDVVEEEEEEVEEEVEEETSAVNEMEPFVENGYTLSVAPTPTKDVGKLFYSLKESAIVDFTLYTSSEKIIDRVTMEALEDQEYIYEWDSISKLPQGTYYVVMSVGRERVALTRLIKIRK